MYINSSGSVGINTTSPGARLDILGTTPSLHVGDNTGGAPDYRGYSLDFSRRQQTGGINLTASSPSVFLDLYAGGSAANLGDWNGQIRFFTGGNNEYGIERARIDNSGRLLVGTTTPQGTSPHLIQTPQTGTANGANIAGFTIGNSAGEYPSAGYNVRFTGSTTTYQYNGTDYAVMIRYGQSSGRIETFTAASGTGGNTISFTPGPYVANNGGSWTSSSDERLKTDLVPIEDGLNKVATLRSVIGRFKTDEPEKKRAFLIAQDVQKVLPEAVDTVDPNSLGLSYTETIPLLVAALKEAKERIEQLEAKVAVFEGV
jgi:hypothetical protein